MGPPEVPPRTHLPAVEKEKCFSSSRHMHSHTFSDLFQSEHAPQATLSSTAAADDPASLRHAPNTSLPSVGEHFDLDLSYRHAVRPLNRRESRQDLAHAGKYFCGIHIIFPDS